MEKLLAFFALQSPAAEAILSMGIILAAGFLMTRLTKLLKLPNVTAYILTGIVLGPFCLNLIPSHFVERTEFLPDIALAFIAFSTGEFFRLGALKKSGGRVVVITLAESLAASLLVFVLMYFVLRLPLAFSVVLSALASATAPASTLMTIRQTGAKGDFVNTLLQVVALDDIVGLIAYSLAISVALSAMTGSGIQPGSFLLPLLKNAGVIVLGALFGILLMLLMKRRHSSDNRLIVAVALLLFFCGICTLLDISPLLGCMSMSTVYINTTDDDGLFKQLNYFSPPILLMFFVRSGLSFDLGALFRPSGSFGSHSLVIIGVLYFFVRIIGKYAGAYLSCRAMNKPVKTSRYLGLALIPQAGVAIGLAALGARVIGGETGKALETIILSSSILYELIGPACAKLALYRSGAYSHKLEEMVSVPEVEEGGRTKSQLQLLIDRIDAIQKQLPARPVNEEEKAFTDAALEQLDNLRQRRSSFGHRPGFRR